MLFGNNREQMRGVYPRAWRKPGAGALNHH